MFCQYCGKEINDDADLCLNCGKFVKTEHSSQPVEETSEKSRIYGGLLGLFFGGLGVHNFYLGHKKKGAIQLVLTLVAITLLFVGFISAVGYLIDLGVDLETLAEADLNALTNEAITKYMTRFIIGPMISTIVGIWAFIESILIFCGVMKDKNGKKLK